MKIGLSAFLQALAWWAGLSWKTLKGNYFMSNFKRHKCFFMFSMLTDMLTYFYWIEYSAVYEKYHVNRSVNMEHIVNLRSKENSCIKPVKSVILLLSNFVRRLELINFPSHGLMLFNWSLKIFILKFNILVGFQKSLTLTLKSTQQPIRLHNDLPVECLLHSMHCRKYWFCLSIM